jgi:alpha-ribazole phosphatase/probable phosphoglycerate mutase
MSGWTDLPLNPTGLQQRERLHRRFLAEKEIEAIYSSPLQRARSTATAIAEATGLMPRFDPDLREIHCGEVDGQPIAFVKQRFPELWNLNLSQLDDQFRWPAGESYREFRERCVRALDRIAEAHAARRVILVTHAGVVTQVLGAIHGLRPARWEPFRPENTSLTEIHWQAGAGELLSFNDHRHLTAW